MLTGMWSNKNSDTLLVVMQNDTATLEDSLVIFTKLNILLPYYPTITLLGIYQKKLKTYVHPHKNLHMDVYSSVIIISKTLKQPTMVHPENGMLFSTKKRCVTKP